MQTGFSGRRLAYVSLTVGPLLGVAAIVASWLIAHRELRGDADVVLLLVGPLVSAALTLTYCLAAEVRQPDGFRATLLSFGFALFWSLLALVAIELYWLIIRPLSALD